MKLAQQEIKATVTVNTSDLGSKKKDDDASDKDAPARKKAQGSGEWGQGGDWSRPCCPGYSPDDHANDWHDSYFMDPAPPSSTRPKLYGTH